VADGFHAGYALQAIHEVVLKFRHHGAIVQVGTAGGDLKRKDVFGVVPSVHIAELPETAHEQRRTHEEDEC
jgi:hypothetical protein